MKRTIGAHHIISTAVRSAVFHYVQPVAHVLFIESLDWFLTGNAGRFKGPEMSGLHKKKKNNIVVLVEFVRISNTAVSVSKHLHPEIGIPFAFEGKFRANSPC